VEVFVCMGASFIGLATDLHSVRHSRASRSFGLRLWPYLGLLWLLGPPGLAAQTPKEWQSAAHNIRRLPPDSFPQLPAAIRSALRARGCTVPQSSVDGRPHNVVSGSFARARQRDWAVLCSRHDSSSVLIFWGGADSETPADFGPVPDAAYLQDIGKDRIGYSRLIAVASPARIREYASAFHGPLPETLDHDGLEDAFAGKASALSYLDRGRWVSLAGTD
jgi:hypothetical protein